MSEDQLVRAARALRESRTGASPQAMTTRSRVLAHAAMRRRRWRSVALVLLPLAAAFVMSSAWAAVTGRIPALTALLGVAPRTATRPLVGARSPSHDAIEDVAAPAPSALLPAPEASGPVAPVALVGSETPTIRDTTAPTLDSIAPKRSVSSNEVSRRSQAATAMAAADAEESLYAEAHRAHFVARDPASALRLWEAYLAAFPNGRFALEARYNRALTLVRLGRRADARAALLPFAEGESGGYRREEARALLDALGAGP